MNIFNKFLGTTILASSMILSGCSAISLPQDVTEAAVPEPYSMISNKMDGRDSENKMTLVFHKAEMRKNDDGGVVVILSGRFHHSNPKIKTDSPFIGVAGVSLASHGNGIVSISRAEPLELSLLSVHAPVKSLVNREANDIFKKAVKDMEGRYLDEQKMLKLSQNLQSLFN